MSIRAYKVIEIKTEQTPSFNLWHDQRIIDFIEENQVTFYNDLDHDGCGLVHVKVSTIMRILNQTEEFALDEDQIKQLTQDIKGLTSDEFVQYYCI